MSSAVVNFIERTLSRKPFDWDKSLPDWSHKDKSTSPFAVKDDFHVVIVGGGIAGSLFARQLLRFTASGPKVRITMLNNTSCNYCGGLITNVAHRTLKLLFDYDIPQDLILGNMDECIFVNKFGSVCVKVNRPLLTMLRTDRFGYPGFDDYLRATLGIGIPDAKQRLQVIEPVTVTQIIPPSCANKGAVSYHRYEPTVGYVPSRIDDVDFVALATGIRNLKSNVVRDFCSRTGFVPPGTMDASVTEIDSSTAEMDLLENRMVIVDNVVPNCVAAIIHKRPGWVTATSLHKVLTRKDIEEIFAAPKVRQYIKLSEPSQRLRCKTVCKATVYVSPARRFCGDGWVALGDLSGHGRVLKDGYFAAFLGAHLAAWTLVTQGATREAFARYYHRPLRQFNLDNKVGMAIFELDRRLSMTHWFPKAFMKAAAVETSKGGGPIEAAIRALATGELSYKMITSLILWGVLSYCVSHPVRG